MADVAATPYGQGEHHPEKNYLNAEKGIKSWIFTLDHKRIGILYLILILTFFLAAVLLGGLIRLELLKPLGGADHRDRIALPDGVR